MSYTAKLESVFAMQEDAAERSYWLSLIERGEAELARIIGTIPEKLRQKAAFKIIDRLLQQASKVASKVAGKKQDWRLKPKYEPIREAVDLGDAITAINFIITGLDRLDLPTPEQAKILKKVVTTLKGSYKFPFQTQPWQAKHMAENVENIINDAIKANKTVLKIDLHGLDRKTVENALRHYLNALRKRGLITTVKKVPGYGIHFDFTASFELMRLAQLEAPLAKQMGPDRNGFHIILVGDVLDKILERRQLSQDEMMAVLKHHLRLNKLDPDRVYFSTRGKPGTRRKWKPAAA